MNKFCLIFYFSISLLGAYAQDGLFKQDYSQDDKGNWTTPINMGYPANSTEGDVV